MALARAEFKKGDKIIVVASYSGIPEGVVMEILRCSGGAYICRQEGDATNRQWTIYYARYNNTQVDEIVPADRKTRADYLQKKVDELEDEIKKHKRDIDILKNFESEEDYVAHKLHIIFENKDNPKAMAEALKELRNSHIL